VSFTNQDAASAAANRIITPTAGTIAVLANEVVVLQYDSTDSRWRIVARPDLNTGGGGVSDGDKGDITVSSSGTIWTIDNDVVNFAKMQNIATDKLLGRDTASSGDTEEIALSTGLEFTGSAEIRVKSVTDSDLSTLAGIAGNDQDFRAFRTRVSVTATATLSTTHQNAFLDVDSASTVTLTIPNNSTTAFAVGTEIEIYRQGAGAVTIADEASVVVQENGTATAAGAFSKSITTRYTMASIKKIATDVWILIGTVA
ncbi:MAG: hypothetical protein ACRDEA_00100, partial [Microcystaceae cyanobacterium]